MMVMAGGITARSVLKSSDGADPGLTLQQTAFIIKWVVTAVIVVALLAFFLGGYFHAQARMKKGLPPLRYHRVCVFLTTHFSAAFANFCLQFLVPRRQRERFFPPSPRTYYHNQPYGHGPAMPLNSYGPPPPAYGENDYVPPYAPPQGGSKVNPDQSYHQPGHNEPGSGPSQPAPAAGVYR